MLFSCVESANVSRTDSDGVENTKSSVSPGYGRILADNPISVSGKTTLSQDFNLNKLLQSKQVFITDKTQLIKDCEFIDNCIIVTKDESIEPFTNSDSRWAFATNSSEFLQVNSYAHAEILYKRFLQDLTTHTTTVAPLSLTPSPSVYYPTSIPENYFAGKSFWGGDKNLRIYADCNLNNNAVYFPSKQVICMGFDRIYQENVKFAQDSTVIYHEMGHKYAQVMMNMRNTIDTSSFVESQLGYHSYDEAGAINEGISDFFSFYINGRKHMGEWALGRFNKASRPLSEDDPLHAAGIGLDSNSRLSYPTFVAYNPNDKELEVEDIHFAGQIFSHYLTALTDDVVSNCSVTQSRASSIVTNILTEALSELGDLTSQGNDNYTGLSTVNLNSAYSHDWLRKYNPITFRRMAQYMAKYAKYILVDSGTRACTSGGFTTDIIESTLDSYGLLLFRTYNESGNGDDITSFVGTDTAVSPLNRRKTELISKSLLLKESRGDFSDYTVFDKRETIKSIMDNFLDAGLITPLSNISDSESFGYNNGNGRVSPGEVVGLFINMYNNSNSTMGGVRVSAADWLHSQDGVACSNLSDGFPTNSQGGMTCNAFSAADINDVNKFQPVCMLEYNDGSSTKILTQAEYFKKIKNDAGFLAKDCLDPDDTRTCMIRAVDGADTSYVSKINAKSNWLESIKDADGNPTFTTGNLIYFEVNKNIPIGTQVYCKLRASFTNCDDCYHDTTASNDDYLDWVYATEKPYNIVNINFQVTD